MTERFVIAGQGVGAAVALEAVRGRACAGLHLLSLEGFVARLELEVGLPPPPPRWRRVLALASRGGRPWAPRCLASASELLSLADALRMAGAVPEGLPARWRRTLATTFEVHGNLADRIAAVMLRPLDALAPRPLVLELERESVPARFRALVDTLEGYGWEVSWPSAEGDGAPEAVVLLRGASPTAVAELAVGVTAAACDLPVVWVGADSLVERCLVAHGQPPLGLDSPTRNVASLLTRVLRLAVAPQRPEDLLELLLDPALPLVREDRARLCAALQAWPSWRHEGWISALSQLDHDPEHGVAMRAWLEGALVPLSDDDACVPVEPFRTRLRELSVLFARASTREDDPRVLGCTSALARLGDFVEETLPLSLLTELLAWDDEVSDSSSGTSPGVGALALPSLDAVVSELPSLVLWDAAAEARDPFARLLPTERSALRAAGCSVPDTATLAASAHRARLRGLARVRGTAWICLPATDVRGEVSADPAWLADLDAWARARRLPGLETHGGARSPRELRPGPRPRVLWRVEPSTLVARPKESPSSVATWLGCSLRHALVHQARLDDPLGLELPRGPLLWGRVAHAVFEGLWREVQAPYDDDTVAGSARRRVDAVLASHATTLTLPSAQGERAWVTQAVVRAAVALGALLREAGLRVVDTERMLGRRQRLAGVRCLGRADLVLGPTPVVLDLKWSPGKHRQGLVEGTALQPALYAWMLRGHDALDDEAAWPAVGYLVVTTRRVHATPGISAATLDRVHGPPLRATVAGAARALRARLEERARGELVAPGALGDSGRDVLDEGVLSLEAPCGFCGFAALCGRGGLP